MKFGLIAVVASAFVLSACDMGHDDMGDDTPIYTKDGMVVPMDATVVDDAADMADDAADDAADMVEDAAEEAVDMAEEAVSDAM